MQDKKKETNIEKYGYGCALQNPEIYEKNLKSCYNFKNYILPNGKIVQIQGYENLALDIIIETKMTDTKDIIVDNIEIRKILGDFKYTLDKRERIYFPDIYLKNLNLIIEVKSEYTYENKLEENLKKKESVLNKGINFEFWVLDKDSKLNKI